MNRIRNLIAAGALALGLVFAAGCAGKSAATVAYNATDTTLSGVDAAISEWADYVVRERARIADLRKTDPGAAIDANTALLNKEGKVSAAYYRYQDAAKTAITLGATAAGTTNSLASISSAVGVAASELIGLVNTLSR